MSNINFPIDNTWYYAIIIAILFAVMTIGLIWILISKLFKSFRRASGIYYTILNWIGYISILLSIGILWWIWTLWAYLSN